LRYTGQGYELRVPLDGLGAGGFTDADMAAARDRFDEHHARLHGHAAKERAVELVSYRLRVRLAVPRYEPVAAQDAAAAVAPAAAVKGTRTVYFEAEAGTSTTLYERDRLPVGATLAGPAIVEQFDSTTVVPDQWTAAVDRFRNLILSREA
jgi:N-methylhydantoinase A